MRLNRGTIVMLVAAIAVIALVLFLNSDQTADDTATDTTPTVTSAAGPLFTGVDAASITTLEIRNNLTGDYVRLIKDIGGAWTIAGTYSRSDIAASQEAIGTSVSNYVSLQTVDSFESSDLAQFGLDQPLYTFTITQQMGIGGQYQLHIGNVNPTGNRYYVVATQNGGTSAEATAPVELTAEATAALMEATADVIAEATSEATAESAALDATADATAEMTVEATADATAEITAEATAELDRITAPRPTLTGTQLILTITKTVIDPLIALINVPPYSPTATPTGTATNTPNPFSEVDQTATATTLFATQEAQMNATLSALMTAVATVEVTAEATSDAVTTAEATAETTAAP